MKNKDLAIEWFQYGDDESGKCSNLFYEGGIIYSYGRHFPIARKVNGDFTLCTTRGYSNTTARHISHVRMAIKNKRLDVDDIMADTPARHAENVKLMDEELERIKGKYERARTYKDMWARDMVDLVENRATYMELFLPDVLDEEIRRSLQPNLSKRAVKVREVA